MIRRHGDGNWKNSAYELRARIAISSPIAVMIPAPSVTQIQIGGVLFDRRRVCRCADSDDWRLGSAPPLVSMTKGLSAALFDAGAAFFDSAGAPVLIGGAVAPAKVSCAEPMTVSFLDWVGCRLGGAAAARRKPPAAGLAPCATRSAACAAAVSRPESPPLLSPPSLLK